MATLVDPITINGNAIVRHHLRIFFTLCQEDSKFKWTLGHGFMGVRPIQDSVSVVQVY